MTDGRRRKRKVARITPYTVGIILRKPVAFTRRMRRAVGYRPAYAMTRKALGVLPTYVFRMRRAAVRRKLTRRRRR